MLTAVAHRKKPLVIAHRGSSDERAEHTLVAYTEAIEAGADALECDVRLTADTVLVCVHDRRIDRVSDGRGVVANQTLAQLEQRDFAQWKHQTPVPLEDDLGPYDDVARRVLTLDALLDLATSADRPVGLSIETKHPTRFGGLVENLLVASLERYGLLTPRHRLEGRVRLMSFSEAALRRMRGLAPDLRRVYLMDRVPVRCRTGWLPYGARIAGPGIHVLRKHPGYVAKVRAAGGKVHVWTVDEPEDVDLCLELGVDGIITNRPDAVRRQVDAEFA